MTVLLPLPWRWSLVLLILTSILINGVYLSVTWQEEFQFQLLVINYWLIWIILFPDSWATFWSLFRLICILALKFSFHKLFVLLFQFFSIFLLFPKLLRVGSIRRLVLISFLIFMPYYLWILMLIRWSKAWVTNFLIKWYLCIICLVDSIRILCLILLFDSTTDRFLANCSRFIRQQVVIFMINDVISVIYQSQWSLASLIIWLRNWNVRH